MTQFRYASSGQGSASLMPWMPISLGLYGRSIEVMGLLDTGAAVNVLPYEFGLELGAVWEAQTTVVPLVGSLGQFEARALLLQCAIDSASELVRLVFAWTKAENAPLILGQMNFFLEFDVCFFRAQGIFEVQRKAL